ncbi:hypothetical protein EEL32_12115 [Brevibacillus laterosporus]|nr:host-nuclease inhibitor Gam family protein [Brevibacillus laterosporus]TPG86851.1 hypothetical protein EEL32_12115 [Brevibacillus laterosporus]
MNLSALQTYELNEVEDMRFELSEEEAKQRFRVHDLDSLNWVLRKISALDSEILEKQSLANKEKMRVTDWLNRETKTIEDNRVFFSQLIEEYAREQRAVDPKWKASTPYGKVSFRKQQPKWDYVDEKAAIESIQSAGLDEFIRTKYELDKAPLKKHLKAHEDGRVVDPSTGNFIEGIQVIEQPEALKIEVTNE